MGISDSEFQHAKARFPSLEVAKRAPNGQIDRVTVAFKGVIGRGNTAQRVYKAVITLDGFPNSPPVGMISDPPVGQIQNIHIHGIDPALKLPLICIGGAYAQQWKGMPVKDRTLLHYLLAATYVLLCLLYTSPSPRD